MIKNVFLALLQFILFLLVFAAGSFFPVLHIEHVLGVTSDGTRVFIVDGVLFMSALFVVIMLIEAARKRIQTAGLWTTAAFILATSAGLALKLGFLTRPL